MDVNSVYSLNVWCIDDAPAGLMHSVGSQRASNWINPPGRKSSRRQLIHAGALARRHVSRWNPHPAMCICNVITQQQTIFVVSIRLSGIVVLMCGSLINRNDVPRQPRILRRRSHSVEQPAVRHSNCFFCDNFQESTQDSFIYPVILHNIISSVRCCTAPFSWLYGHVTAPYKLSYYYYYLLLLSISKQEARLSQSNRSYGVLVFWFFTLCG